MRHYQKLYNPDVATLKQYGIDKFKLTAHKLPVRQKGFEVGKPRILGINDKKLENNISRTKSKVFELAYCNPFNLFVTLTIDQRKYDRKDLKRYHKDLTQFIRDYNKKHRLAIKYLLIPERHKDGSWHMHGFLMGLPIDHLAINEHGYMDWQPYREKFGFISIDRIRSQEGASKYITKYISKDLSDAVQDLGAHMYYCSQGLNRAVEIKRGTLSANSIPFDFENDYVKTKWLHDKASALILIE